MFRPRALVPRILLRVTASGVLHVLEKVVDLSCQKQHDHRRLLQSRSQRNVQKVEDQVLKLQDFYQDLGMLILILFLTLVQVRPLTTTLMTINGRCYRLGIVVLKFNARLLFAHLELVDTEPLKILREPVVS